MSELAQKIDINWYCKHTWRRASYNTMWCLLGCSIGDFGTIAYFQFMGIAWPVIAIMTLAIINGLITSILLETFILFRQMPFKAAFQTAIGYVPNFNDIDGGCNELDRFYCHWGRKIDMVGHTFDVASRFFNASSL